LRLLSHGLDRIHYILRLIVVGVAEVGRPLEVLVHLGEHGWERGERFYAGIPGTGVGSSSNLLGGGVALGLPPAIGFDDLGWISRGCKNLRYQRVRIKSNWSYQLVQLIGRQRLRLGGVIRGRGRRRGR
jgi:hypothetical protein